MSGFDAEALKSLDAKDAVHALKESQRCSNAAGIRADIAYHGKELEHKGPGIRNPSAPGLQERIRG